MSEAPVAEQQERPDPLLAARLAQMELERTSAALLDRRDAVEQQQAAAAERNARLNRWVELGFGNMPLPESAADLNALPAGAQMMLRASAPDLVAAISGVTQPLPAELELRLQRGIEHLRDEDLEPLQRAGRLDVIEAVKEKAMAQRIAAFEEGQRQAAEAAAAQQLAWEQQRLQGQERFNAAARAHAISRMHAGLPPAPISF